MNADVGAQDSEVGEHVHRGQTSKSLFLFFIAEISFTS